MFARAHLVAASRGRADRSGDHRPAPGAPPTPPGSTTPGNTPAAPTTAAAAAPLAAPASCPAARWASPTSGTTAAHDVGPTVHHRRPSEMRRNARTIAGSNWPPAHAASSRRAAGTLIGFLYERAAVITSNESVTLTILAACEISEPASRFR